YAKEATACGYPVLSPPAHGMFEEQPVATPDSDVGTFFERVACAVLDAAEIGAGERNRQICRAQGGWQSPRPFLESGQMLATERNHGRDGSRDSVAVFARKKRIARGAGCCQEVERYVALTASAVNRQQA